ncbi:hypothetical protein HYDPIDRAFT_27805 [Hydnomerulius pinastri MD-312]|uniref:WD40 repeat-like protein n=1 Tax=Hydnomerulius pinastri MD-312 TaxID=994086 RepID=A0A0C9WGA3_9AGAM|nr:hypothetical protein HYDPIDRAFT_27805 [Hydnomerulius pinastri MD-312]
MFSAIATVFTQSLQRYTNVASFTPNTPSVHALAISNDGDFLASGGKDGIKLWNIKSRKELTCSNHESYGAVSCATWMKTKHGAMSETLCYGTGLGYLIFLRPNPVDKNFQEICARRLGSGFEITCVAWDMTWSEAGSRIAVGMRDNVVQVLLLNANSQLQPVFAGRLENTVPKSITFVPRGSVYIFGLYDGNIIKMNAIDGAILSEHCCDSVIGCAAVSPKKELAVIDNATNGFTLYRLDSGKPLRTFVTDPPSVPVPKQVAFGEESKVVIGGSDNGFVYIFERRTGQLLEKLPHSKTGLVQTISVRDIGGRCIVASASPSVGRKKAAIRVWVHEYETYKASAGSDKWGTCMSTVKIVALILGVVLVIISTGIGILALKPDIVVTCAISIPQISQWCARLPVQRPVHSPEAPLSQELPKVQQEIPMASKSDLETLKELALHLMDLAQAASRETVHAHRDMAAGHGRMGVIEYGEVEAGRQNMAVGSMDDPKTVRETSVIYL